MSDAEQPRNPSLETLDCLDARLIELDLLEQAMDGGRDLTTFKLQRLEDLQNRRAKLQSTHQAETKPADGGLREQIEKLLFETGGDFNVDEFAPYFVRLFCAHLQAAEEKGRSAGWDAAMDQVERTNQGEK